MSHQRSRPQVRGAGTAGVRSAGVPTSILAPGDAVLDRYRVVEPIARGGHSAVYRGTDTRLDRPVCIKVFTSVPGDPGVAKTSYEHFVQEAFALSRLTHPHTLRIYDFGHLGEAVPFHVSEFMNGGTLTQLVRDRGTLAVEEMLRVTLAMCEALAEAHALGIVHRDVKPHNILFANVGGARLAKLADFGVAKWHEDQAVESPAARAGDTQVVSGQRMAMYSPSWAAPEQLAGQAVTASADLYSLAAVAVYMVSGVAIFADEDVYEGYRKRQSSDELVAEALAPLELAPAGVELLAQALRFHPDERPGDASAFAVALREAFEPSTGPRAPVPPRPPVEVITPAPARAARAQPPRRLVSGEPFQIAQRAGSFVPMAGGIADVVGLGGSARLRLTVLPSVGGVRQLHVKGLSSFLGKPGGRPSVAVQIDRDAMLDLYGRSNTVVGRVRLSFGTPAAGHTTFRFGDESVAVSLDECPDPVLVDFGGGAECAIACPPVYNQLQAARTRKKP